LFGWTAFFLGLFLFALPAELLWNLVNKKQEAKFIPYMVFVTSICCGYFWITYALKLGFVPIYIQNMIACFIHTIYLSVFLIHITEYDIKKSALIIISILGAEYIIEYIIWNYISTSLIGVICIFVTSFVYMSPSQKIGEMFRTGNHNILPIKITLTVLVLSFSWVLYGILNDFDINIVIPNFIGFVVSLVSAYYWRELYIKNSENGVTFITNENSENNTINNINNSQNEITNTNFNNISILNNTNLEMKLIDKTVKVAA